MIGAGRVQNDSGPTQIWSSAPSIGGSPRWLHDDKTSSCPMGATGQHCEWAAFVIVSGGQGRHSPLFFSVPAFFTDQKAGLRQYCETLRRTRQALKFGVFFELCITCTT